MEVQYGVCVQCHGLHGEGRPELGAPRIGDLDAAYVTTQLRAFRGGLRGHPGDTEAAWAMGAIGQGLPDALIDDLADFVAERHPAPQPPGPADARGASLYRPCATCHGAKAEGRPELNAPALAQQDEAYLLRQLQSFRDGRRNQGLSAAMAAQIRPGTPDDDLRAMVRHVVSLRPPLPPKNDPPVTRSEAEGLAAWADIYSVVTHPRCMNCHPDGDAPKQGDDSHLHRFKITRFSPLEGVHCTSCHAPSGVYDGQVPFPPADPVWSMPPRAMAFENRTSGALCKQLQDPAVNGGRGLSDTLHHIESDHLLITSWHSGREAPPITHAELVQRVKVWGEAGGPCPPE